VLTKHLLQNVHHACGVRDLGAADVRSRLLREVETAPGLRARRQHSRVGLLDGRDTRHRRMGRRILVQGLDPALGIAVPRAVRRQHRAVSPGNTIPWSSADEWQRDVTCAAEKYLLFVVLPVICLNVYVTPLLCHVLTGS
jgi:hypothetical protein